VSANSNLRVVFYNPSGHGGICHYTHQLADNLASLGVDATILTSEGYELEHLNRNFTLKMLFRKSRIKNLAAKFITQVPTSVFFNRRSNSNGRNPIDRPISQSEQTVQILGFLKILRLRLLLYKTAIALLLHRPDVIHIQWLIDRSEDYKFIRLLKRLGFTTVYTVHDLLPQEAEAHPDYDVIRKIYRTVDAIIVHAERHKTEIISVFGVDSSKVHVIPHGSNGLFYTKNPVSKEIARKELDISPAQKVILFFGIIKRYKGLEYLVEAFQEIKKEVDNALLLVVGSIYDGDREGFKYYSRLIDKLRTRDDVICVPDYIRFEKIGEYFCAADVVVLPYTKTYTSGILLTAYAAGRPTVVTDTGALSEVVESGKSGFVVPPRDSRALSKAIVEIVNGSDMERMGNYARHLAETKYSWRSVALKTSDLYRSLTVGG
jgi:glycosyltransferase involved in cell wall biosynthesis